MNERETNSMGRLILKTWMRNLIIALMMLTGAAGQSFGQTPPAGMALIPDGVYRPLFRAESDPNPTFATGSGF
jgi:hypothetical protein